MAESPKDWKQTAPKKKPPRGGKSSWRKPNAAFAEPTAGRGRLVRMGLAGLTLFAVLTALFLILRRRPPASLLIEPVGFADYDDTLPAQAYADGDLQALAALPQTIRKTEGVQSVAIGRTVPVGRSLPAPPKERAGVALLYVRGFALREGGADGRVALLTDKSQVAAREDRRVPLVDFVSRLVARYPDRVRKLVVLDIAGLPIDWRAGHLGTGLQTKALRQALRSLPNTMLLLPGGRTGQPFGSGAFGSDGQTALGHFLIRGLRGAADGETAAGPGDDATRDGRVMASELVRYVRRRTAEWVFQNREERSVPQVAVVPASADDPAVPAFDFEVLRHVGDPRLLPGGSRFRDDEPAAGGIDGTEAELLARLASLWDRIGDDWSARAERASTRPLLWRASVGRLRQAEAAWLAGQSERCGRHLDRAETLIADLIAPGIGPRSEPWPIDQTGTAPFATPFLRPHFASLLALDDVAAPNDRTPIAPPHEIARFHLSRRGLPESLADDRPDDADVGDVQGLRIRAMRLFDQPFEAFAPIAESLPPAYADLRKAEDLLIAGGDGDRIRDRQRLARTALESAGQRGERIAEAVRVRCLGQAVLPMLARWQADLGAESDREALLRAASESHRLDPEGAGGVRRRLERQSATLKTAGDRLDEAYRTLQAMEDVRAISDALASPDDAASLDDGSLRDRVRAVEEALARLLGGIATRAGELSQPSEQPQPSLRRETLALLHTPGLSGERRAELLRRVRDIEARLLRNEAVLSATVGDQTDAADAGGGSSGAAPAAGSYRDRALRETVAGLQTGHWQAFWLTRTLRLAGEPEAADLYDAWVASLDAMPTDAGAGGIGEAARAFEELQTAIRRYWSDLPRLANDDPSDRGAALRELRRGDRIARCLLAFDAESHLDAPTETPTGRLRRALLASRLLALADACHRDFWAGTADATSDWYSQAGAACLDRIGAMYPTAPQWLGEPLAALQRQRTRLADAASRGAAVTAAGSVRVGGPRGGGAVRVRVETTMPDALDGFAGVFLARPEPGERSLRIEPAAPLAIRDEVGEESGRRIEEVAFAVDVDREASGDCEPVELRPLVAFRGHRWQSNRVVRADPCRAEARTLAWSEARPNGSIGVVGRDDYRVMFVLDCSQSMEQTAVLERDGDDGEASKWDRSRMKAARDALAESARALSPDSQVGLLLYGHRLQLRGGRDIRNDHWPKSPREPQAAIDDFGVAVDIGPRKSNLGPIEEALDQIKPWGITPMFGAIERALEEMKDKGSGDRRPAVVVVITDGVPTDVDAGIYRDNLRQTFADRIGRVGDLLSKTQASLVIVEFGGDLNESADAAAGARVRRYRERLQELTSRHAVEVMPAPKREDLITRLREALRPTTFSLVRGQSEAIRENEPINRTVRDLQPGDYRIEVAGLEQRLRLEPGVDSVWEVDFGDRILRRRPSETDDPFAGGLARLGGYRADSQTDDGRYADELRLLRPVYGTDSRRLALTVLLAHPDAERAVLVPPEFRLLVRSADGLVPDAVRIVPATGFAVPAWTAEVDDWPQNERLQLDAFAAAEPLTPDAVVPLRELFGAPNGRTVREIAPVAGGEPQPWELRAVRRGGEVTVSLLTQPKGGLTQPIDGDEAELLSVWLGQPNAKGEFVGRRHSRRIEIVPDDGLHETTFEAVADADRLSVAITLPESASARLTRLERPIETGEFDLRSAEQ